ncbi:MAG: ribonuclease R [Clostridia bacterium]|nr:ribonuclease R [Clostridia bacterium]
MSEEKKNSDRHVVGILQCNSSGSGFVTTEDGEEIFIHHRGLGKAYDRDTVLVRIDGDGDGRGHREGHIERVVERGNTQIIGIVRNKKRDGYRISPDRRAFFSRVRVKDIEGAKPGDRVVAEITGYNARNKPVGKITAVLGEGDSVMGCLNGIIAENGIPRDFTKETLDEAAIVPETVSDISGREDLRDKLIFTIDGDDSRDFDDAVSLEPLPNGKRLLGVHIADVAHYVREGSALDNEAIRRGTSVYFPNMVIPMLPEQLSNGICSLNPDADRLTLSVFMEIDKNGEITAHRMAETVIHSAARMTYKKVNAILDGDDALSAEYGRLVPVITEMAELAKKLKNKRIERGAIDFDFPESEIICDDKGEPTDVYFEVRGAGERIIEEFMLAANETVAEDAYWAELPFVYRVHDAPDTEKIKTFNDFIKNFGLSLKGKTENIFPMDIQTVLDAVKGRPEERIIGEMALRSLMKACYRDANSGHFGLAARYYCHFTSPIRRYPDLMIHRILKEHIRGEMSAERIKHYTPITCEAAALSSMREVRAENTERAASDMLKTAYMRRFIGESFDAVISSVTSFGMFAELPNSCEGLIRCEDMQSDWFEFDEERRTLTGRTTGVRYTIGDQVRVTVTACNIIKRQTDLMLEDDVIGYGIPQRRGRRR